MKFITFTEKKRTNHSYHLWYDSYGARSDLPRIHFDRECENFGCGVMVNLQQLINSSLSLRLVSALARSVSPRLGYPIAYFIAGQLARQRKSPVIQAVRSNQWVIHGKQLSGEALDRAVHENLRHWARCIFDLYHFNQNLAALKKLIVLEPTFQALAQRPEFDRRGLIIIGLHMSSFDLVLQWVCSQWMKPLVITIPDPQGGRRMEFEMRKRTGINLLPASVGALRQALKHLQQGGMIVTGADRPIPEPEVYPAFFGSPAALPVHHIFLATRAQVPIVVGAVHFQQDRKYHVFASDCIEMESHSDPKTGALRNAEKVLNTAEQFIRHAPQQWSVPLPVWPDIMDLVPK